MNKFTVIKYCGPNQPVSHSHCVKMTCISAKYLFGVRFGSAEFSSENSLKDGGVTAYATAECVLQAGGGVLHPQGAVVLRALQLRDFGAAGALGQLVQGDAADALELIMTSIAEVCVSEAEEHGHRAAEAAFVLQEVNAVAQTGLSLCDIRAPSADQLLRVVLGRTVGLALRLSSVVGLNRNIIFKNV